jgi:hypothetical protein
MNADDLDRILDERLRTFLDARSADLAEMTDRASTTTVLDRRLHGTPDVRARGSGRLVLVAVVAALVVTLVAVAISGIGRRVGPLPVADISAPPAERPSGPPAFESRHRSVTSLGAIEWTRTDPGRQLNGFWTFDGKLLASDQATNTWWLSSDGLSWSEMTLPGGDPSDYLDASGQTLAVISGMSAGTMMGPQSHREVISREWQGNPADAAVLRWDVFHWVPIALPATAPSDVDGLVWHGPQLHGGAALDPGNWIVPAVHWLEVPWREVLDLQPAGTDAAIKADDPWPFWDPVAEVLLVYPAGKWKVGPPLARLHVMASDSGSEIEFRDADNGDLVHRVPASVPGWSAESLVRALRGWGLEDASFIVSRDGDLSVVRPPWVMGEEWADGIVTFDGSYFAISLPLGQDYLAETVHLWTSRDGLSWEPVDLPAGMTARLDHADLISGPRGLVMLINGVGTDRSVWASSDGRTWGLGDDDDEEMSTPWPGTFGWVMGNRISPDGLTWEPLDLPRLSREFLEPQAFGDRLVYGPGNDPGPGGTSGRVLWVGRMGETGP